MDRGNCKPIASRRAGAPWHLCVLALILQIETKSEKSTDLYVYLRACMTNVGKSENGFGNLRPKMKSRLYPGFTGTCQLLTAPKCFK